MPTYTLQTEATKRNCELCCYISELGGLYGLLVYALRPK